MRRKLRQLLKGEYSPRGMCFTGAEVPVAAGATAAAGSTAAGLTAAELAAEYAAYAGSAEAAAAGAGAAAGGAGGLGTFFANNALPLGLQVGGTLLKGSAAADAAARKKRLVDAMSAYQTGNATKSMDVTGKFIEGATPEARGAAMQSAEDENRLGYEKTVGAAQAFERPGGVSGNLSDQFKQASANSADAAANRTKRLIENLSRMRAPGVAGATESRRFGRAAGEVDAFNSANAGVGRAYSTDMANVQADPWAGVGGDALTGIGLGLADKMKKLRASAL